MKITNKIMFLINCHLLNLLYIFKFYIKKKYVLCMLNGKVLFI